MEEIRTRSEIQVSALQAKLVAATRGTNSPAAEAELEARRREVDSLKRELEAARELLRLLSPEAPAPESADEIEFAATGPAAVGAPITAIDFGREHVEIEQMVAKLRADTSQVELLDRLAQQFAECGGNAVASGFPAVYRLTTACADVVSWLRKVPGKIPGSMVLLEECCALLRQLYQTGVAGSISDPAGASVYAVDNDEDNCECLVMALEKAALQTRYATKADVAFGELAEAQVDLIVLDVDLGDSDGFNLHDLIRQIEHHENTPVIFVSGLLSTADRLGGLAGPPASFIAKPYNLNELLLKTLCTVVSSRLRKLAA
jgi:CheY-like chemotaxis protein